MDYRARVSLPLDKDLVKAILKRAGVRTLDDYVMLKMQEDLKRLT
tara:strand:- start:618 stop:752 length:135 start_codon:yes stop_codon:yes gene_type:complete